ncbi:hypothetical protein [Lacibacter sp.]|uniref:hypothetical protein n=1 Tax=Lacibacter sp. TaxID=1915409 RepID=UPI002B4B3296|nr:hypothetical protein [Lacibacter sp.]HLP36557.1 hypothetical protein [Lacibacter sp.]
MGGLFLCWGVGGRWTTDDGRQTITALYAGHLLLITAHSLLITDYSSFITHHSSLIIHLSRQGFGGKALLITHYSSFITHHLYFANNATPPFCRYLYR